MKNLSKEEALIASEVVEILSKNRRFNKLEKDLKRFASERNTFKLVETRQEMDKIREIITEQYIKSKTKEKVEFKNLMNKMSPEAKQDCIDKTHAMVIMADWMESFLLDIEAHISEVFPGGRITLWDEFSKAGKASKNAFWHICNSSTDAYNLNIAENSDKMREKTLKMIIDTTKEYEKRRSNN